MARRGPRTGDVDTRGDILEAARDAFAARGFHAATIRSIAAAADVDPALVMHYFGSKSQLFAASLDIPLPVEGVESIVLADGIDGAGRAIAATFFGIWEVPHRRAGLLAMLGGAFTNETAAAALREFITEAIIRRVAAHVDEPDAEQRLALVASHLVGIAIMRYVVGFEQLRDVDVEELIDLVSPRLQSYLTG